MDAARQGHPGLGARLEYWTARLGPSIYVPSMLSHPKHPVAPPAAALDAGSAGGHPDRPGVASSFRASRVRPIQLVRATPPSLRRPGCRRNLKRPVPQGPAPIMIRRASRPSGSTLACRAGFPSGAAASCGPCVPRTFVPGKLASSHPKSARCFPPITAPSGCESSDTEATSARSSGALPGPGLRASATVCHRPTQGTFASKLPPCVSRGPRAQNEAAARNPAEHLADSTWAAQSGSVSPVRRTASRRMLDSEADLH